MDKGINNTTENEEVISLDHYTYGLHPQELGHGIKAYSDELNKKNYESLLEKVINSVNFRSVSKNGEVRIFYVFKEIAIISLVTTDGVDASKRKGIYSHNIFVNLQDYIKLGAHPSIFDQYFKRDVNLRGKIERISVTPVPTYQPIKPVEIPVGTLKNILSVLLRGQGVKLICKNKDSSTILKILYFILGLLPTTERFIPYITVFPEKNQGSYKLIIMQEEEYMLPNKDWLIFDIDQERAFSPKDGTDEAVNSMIDLYSKIGSDGLKESHKLWHEIKQKNPDIINKLEENKRIEYTDDLLLDKKIEQSYNEFKENTVDEIVEILYKDGEHFSTYTKTLITLYEYLEKPKYRTKEVDEKVKFIIKKFVDTLDKTVERKGLLNSKTKTKIPLRTIEKILSSNLLFILIYCLKKFNLGENKKLEKIAKEYVGVIYSSNDKDIKEIIENFE